MALHLNIPAEIIHQILSLLPTTDLASLCLTSSSTRYHAEPYLYSTIRFVWTHRRNTPIVFLLRTLLCRPELFALVDTFCLEGYAHGVSRTLPEVGPLPQDDLRLEPPSSISLDDFISAIRKTEASYTDVWVERLVAGHMDAFAGLLIAYLSNTTSLTIETNYIESFTLIGKILQSKVFQCQPLHSQALQQDVFSDQIPKFTRLQRLVYARRFDQDQQDYDDQFKEAIFTFYLPTLRNIKLWIANPSEFEFEWPSLGEPNLDHITSLDIEWLDAEFLLRILSLTKNLKSLAYSWDYIDVNDEWKIPNLDLDKIITALLPVKATLEKLSVQFRVGFGLQHTYPEMTVSGSFNKLIQFNHIKELHLPFPALSGFELDYTPLGSYIPASVETLSLTNDMMEDYLFDFDSVRPDMTDWGKITKAWGESQIWWRPENTFQSLVLLLAESCPTKLPRLTQLIWFVRMVEDEYIIFRREVQKLSPLLGVDIKVLDNSYMRAYCRYDGP